ncbi:hypothetical protein RRG08_003186 [Elysia crispata]|uniref:Uncharacterized protein n=1 Tax=Elysia crispata TaxID=231223 RepID=A0AAE1B740_9GAST|nr:hypothetical protein RRG08_003186 [Elysia crispata]
MTRTDNRTDMGSRNIEQYPPDQQVNRIKVSGRRGKADTTGQCRIAKHGGVVSKLLAYCLKAFEYETTQGDKCAETVKGRIKYTRDLHAADAVYHQQRNTNFRTGRKIPLAFESHGSDGENKKGRPEDEDRLTSFYKVISCGEKCETITLEASSQETDLSGVSSISFIQSVADNVDHNFRTLDGLGIFHGMGIIGAAIPSKKLSGLIRRDTGVTIRQTSTLGQIPIHQRLAFL